MVFVQWDTQEFYRPPLAALPSGHHPLFLQNLKAEPVIDMNRRPSKAATPIEKSLMTAVYDITQFSTTACSNPIELLSNQSHAFNSVKAKV